MRTDDPKLQRAFREFLWLAVCWNDHNFREGVVAEKCRDLCKELGIKSVDDANRLLDKLQ